MVKDSFARSIFDKLLCLAELDRGTAKDLSKFFMAMSSDTTSSTISVYKDIDSVHDMNISSGVSARSQFAGRKRSSIRV